jgi:putative two-component system response regulator
LSERPQSPTPSDHQPAAGVSTPAGRVLVVDDIAGNITLARSVLERDGYIVTSASTGREALEAVARDLPDLILLDVMMPELDGFEACRRLKSDAATRLLPVVLVTALRNAQDKIRGIEAGADDFLTKPFNAPELRARVRSLIRIKRYTDDLDSAESVIVSLALTIEARDPSTDGHCQRLAAYAAALGAQLGLGEDDLAALERGGFLHDIGKVGVPDNVLLKPGSLTRDEYEQIKAHTVIGDRLCGELRSLRRVRRIVRSHHERLDGTGYPDRLKGDAVPLLAQLMGIVDVFDALTTSRPYKVALPPERAYEELVLEADRGWRRRDLVDVFIALATSGRLPSFFAADTGSLTARRVTVP